MPEREGFHEELFANQTSFINNHPHIISLLQDTYLQHFEEYHGAEEEALLHHGDVHPKRALRLQAHSELEEECVNHDEENLWVKSVLWKLKKNEWAKPGKKPRSIGDLGVAASLLGFRLTNFLKTAQSECPLRINGGDIVFCKSPDPYQLKKHFDNLYDPPARFYYVYFSDDACLAIRRSDGRVDRYNLDISSCDASHSPRLFEMLVDIMPPGMPATDMQRLVDQCKLPLRVVSHANEKHRIILCPKRAMLYSGSTITTGINNLANILIALAVSELDYTGACNENGVCTQLVEAAARAGYIVTGCEPLEVFEDVQFLKNSPVLDIFGAWQPLINFGVFLRASGTCDGDLPGTGDLEARGAAFQRGLLACTFPFASSELIDRLRDALGLGPITTTPSMLDSLSYKTDINSDYPPFRIETSSFCNRYRLDHADYSDLFNDFASMKFGYAYHGECVSKILLKDYGLTTTEHDPTTYLCVQHNSPTTEATY